MAPSAPITPPPPLPAPPLPAPAFGLGLQSNGHTQKLPGKSNLKQKPSTSHSGNGASTLEGRDARFGDDGVERGQGEGGERETKVQWIDNYGKDLTQVFEFEPSDSDDSDDDDDGSDSSQACTCVIQ